jgi:hypothetical protein
MHRRLIRKMGTFGMDLAVQVGSSTQVSICFSRSSVLQFEVLLPLSLIQAGLAEGWASHLLSCDPHFVLGVSLGSLEWEGAATQAQGTESHLYIFLIVCKTSYKNLTRSYIASKRVWSNTFVVIHPPFLIDGETVTPISKVTNLLGL